MELLVAGGSDKKMGTLGRAIYTVGFWIREAGQAVDRLGSRLQGSYYFKEQRTSRLSLTLDPSFMLTFEFRIEFFFTNLWSVWFSFRVDLNIAAVELV